MSRFARMACLLYPERPSEELQENILRLTERFSPFFEVGVDCVFLSVSSTEDECAFAGLLWQETRKIIYRMRIGIARSKTVSRLAALSAKTHPTIVRDCDETAFLAALPLSVLQLSNDTARTFATWGIRTVGAFLRLPKRKITALFGKEGWLLFQRAQGIDPLPFLPSRSSPIFSQKITFEWSIALLEPCIPLLQIALEGVCRQLSLSGLACQSLELAFELDPSGKEIRRLRLRSPSNDVKTLLRLVHLHIINSPPSAPLTGFTLRAHPAVPILSQLSLFGAATLSPARLSTSLVELQTLLGLERAASPRITDDHAPERWAMEEYMPPPVPLLKPVLHSLPALLAVRVLRPAISLRVETSNGSIPATLQDDKSPWKIQGAVRRASGPWYLEARWWSASVFKREYWDILLSDGGVYRLYRDTQHHTWFADGIYD